MQSRKPKKNKVRIPTVKEEMNVLSGVCAAPFVDMLDVLCEEDNSLQGVFHAITALSEESRSVEAIQLITALYDIADTECPAELALIANDQTAQSLFVSEFTADLNDILYEI